MPSAPNRVFGMNGIVPLYPDRCRLKQVKLPANVTYPKGTILGELTGNNDVQTVTITGTPVGGTFTLTWNGQTTAAIAYNATAAQVQSALAALSNVTSAAQQTVTLGGSPTGGTFTLGYAGSYTAPIAYNATAAAVQSALQNVDTIGSGNVTVSGSAGGPYTLTFAGNLAGIFIPALGADASGLVPKPGATVTVAVVTPGGGSSANVACTGGPFPGTAVVVTFQGALGNASQPVMTHTDSFTGGSSPAASVAHTTTGAAGTPGTFAQCLAANTDGSQVPKAILEFDCATDGSGNITIGAQSGGGIWGETVPTCPVFLSGSFKTQDLNGLTDAIVAQVGRYLYGNIAAGGAVSYYDAP